MDGINDNTDDFGFIDSDMSDVDFFSMEENQEENEEQNQNPGSEESNNQEEENQEEENEESLFEAAEENEEENNNEEEEDNEENNENEDNEEALEGESISTLAYLKSKGLIDYELEEGEELDEEKAGEILEDSLDGLFEERIEELFEDVPDIVKEINKFVLKGGDINQFLQKVSMQNESGLTEGMDLEEEVNQEAVIKYGLKEEGYDDEYIKAQIEFLKDSNRLKKHAETHFKKWDKKRKEDQKAILQSQQARLDAEKAQRKALKNKVSTFLKETEEITGFTVTKQDRKSLPNYMSDRTVKLHNGNQITSMQRDLMRVLNSPVGSVQIAKLLKTASEEGELNFDEIKKETETKVTKKVRENVRRNKKSIITQSGSGKSSRKMRLADYFDN